MNVKTNFTLALAIALSTIIAITFSVSSAYAKDVALEKEIAQMSVKLDKNGDEFVTFRFKEPRTLNGISYNITVPATCFASSGMIDQAKQLSEGDMLKVIAKEGEYRGNKSYVILAFIE